MSDVGDNIPVAFITHGLVWVLNLGWVDLGLHVNVLNTTGLRK